MKDISDNNTKIIVGGGGGDRSNCSFLKKFRLNLCNDVNEFIRETTSRGYRFCRV